MNVTQPTQKIIQLGWNLSMLSEEINWSRQKISDVLTGARKTPAIQEALAKAVGMTTKQLFGQWAWDKNIKKRGRKYGEKRPSNIERTQ